MARINSGITGPIYGKVGGIVGFNWKGVNAIRSYAIPANPRTTAQQSERTMFAFIVSVAKLVISTVIHNYWDPFASGMSGWNLFTQKNRATVTSDDDYANLQMSFGDLEGPSNLTADYDSSSGTVSFICESSGLGNGEDSDSLVLVVIDSANNVAFVSDGDYQRSSDPIEMDIGSGRNASDLHAYAFFHRGSGSDLQVSNSMHCVCGAV